jgi:hypothetical protein
MDTARHAVTVFAAGFLATLLFHQGVFALLYGVGIVPMPPFNLEPTEPLGVPSVLSLAFWGGLWALPVWAAVQRRPADRQLWPTVGLGAVGPSLVAYFVVFPIKGIELPFLLFLPIALLLNGAWGFGVWWLVRRLGGSVDSVSV